MLHATVDHRGDRSLDRRSLGRRSLDRRTIGDGLIGPVTRAVTDGYHALTRGRTLRPEVELQAVYEPAFAN